MNPYVLLALLIAFVADGFYWNHHGHQSERVEWQARVEKDRADFEASARTREHKLQDTADEINRKQQVDKEAIQRNLTIALNSLRNRPERPADLPATARPTCSDANGAELSGANARFLERFAALAAGSDTGLAGSYTLIDSERH